MMWFWACELARPRVLPRSQVIHRHHRLLFPSFLHFEPLGRLLCGKPDAQHRHNKDTQPSLPTDSFRLNVVVGVCLPRATPFPKALADLAEALPRSMGTHTPRALTTRRPAPQRPRHPLTHQLHTPLHHTHTQASVAALALRLPSSPPAHDTQTHHPPASSGTILHPTALASSNPRPRLELPPRSAP
jgi:hypothetical protein